MAIRSRRGKLKVTLCLVSILVVELFSNWFMISSLQKAYKADHWVMDIHSKALIDANQLRFLAESKISDARAYFFRGDKNELLPKIEESHTKFLTLLQSMRDQPLPDKVKMGPTRKALFEKIGIVENEHQLVLEQAISIYNKQSDSAKLRKFLATILRPLRQQTVDLLDQLIAVESNHFSTAKSNAFLIESQISESMDLVIIISLILLLTVSLFVRRLMIEGDQLLSESEKLVRSRETMVSVVSHDLKNPLSSILLSTQLLEKKFESLDLKTVKLIQTIQNAGNRMTSLIQDLLDLTKLESNNMVLDQKNYSVETIVFNVSEMFMPIAHDKSVRFEVIEPVPSCSVNCDSERIMQVLSNLIGNAIKFTPENGLINFEVKEVENGVNFSVTDTGQGVGPAQLPYLFDRFWQANKEGRLGTGLGLSIAKGIIEAHGSKLLVCSEEGIGSTFSFTLRRGSV